jgi:hypothetical protein
MRPWRTSPTSSVMRARRPQRATSSGSAGGPRRSPSGPQLCSTARATRTTDRAGGFGMTRPILGATPRVTGLNRRQSRRTRPNVSPARRHGLGRACTRPDQRAEGVGFEPTVTRRPQRLSRPPHSSALATFRRRRYQRPWTTPKAVGPPRSPAAAVVRRPPGGPRRGVRPPGRRRPRPGPAGAASRRGPVARRCTAGAGGGGRRRWATSGRRG